ncbi:hypothetical protein N9L94_06425 [Robiginitalea sp.]|jgi:hypothetical protein|nr:hypothetical protein [Robiginitalea sp.]
MTAADLREKIRALALQVVGEKSKADDAALAYDELTKFPELKDIIVALLTHEFDSFLEGIDWVAPRPSTFRINLLNGQNFLLMYGTRSWIAQVEGKKYYLLNLDEEEYACQAIARILQHGPESGADVEGSETDSTSVEDEVDVDVDVEA